MIQTSFLYPIEAAHTLSFIRACAMSYARRDMITGCTYARISGEERAEIAFSRFYKKHAGVVVTDNVPELKHMFTEAYISRLNGGHSYEPANVAE